MYFTRQKQNTYHGPENLQNNKKNKIISAIYLDTNNWMIDVLYIWTWLKQYNFAIFR